MSANLLAHGLWVGHSGGEESVPADAAVDAGPAVVPRPRVVHRPWDERVALGCDSIDILGTSPNLSLIVIMFGVMT